MPRSRRKRVTDAPTAALFARDADGAAASNAHHTRPVRDVTDSPTAEFPFTLAWFRSRGHTPAPFQIEAWRAFTQQRDGLINAPTGSGKTLAAWMGLIEHEATLAGAPGAGKTAAPLRALWITPLRALAHDTAESLQVACDGVGLNWRVELRTGDTSWAVKQRQHARPPQAMVTTPESLCVLLSRADGPRLLSNLKLVVIDEWHELLGSKRGVLLELALSRLRSIAPNLRTWGVSATIANIRESLDALLGFDPDGTARAERASLIRGVGDKRHEIVTAIPELMEPFPWSGHLGLRQLPRVIEAIESAATTLVFTNTRGQAEIWFQSLVKARPQWLGGVEGTSPGIALHHGSLERDQRGAVESMLKDGSVRAVVCTSSLDLGVDFPPVDQVIQIGSPKGVARLLQRAGRSGHQPGKASRVLCVPTNALELIEFAAVRRAAERRRIEPRRPLRLSMDVLCQHILTAASAGPIDESLLLREVRTTHAFASITDQQWAWALEFAGKGGPAMGAYERMKRLRRNDGLIEAASPAVAKQHRLAIGAIVSDPAIVVRYANGSTIGSVEESFIARLSPGDTFVFAGKRLEFVHLRELTAVVRPASKRSGSFVSWQGARMPLSSELADEVSSLLDLADRGEFDSPEMEASRRLLTLQREWSALPTPDRLVIERCTTREGHHLFVFPLQGRLAHEGLASLCAYRLAIEVPRTFSIACNDYGFELVSPTAIEDADDERLWRRVLSRERLEDDLLACVNAGEMARRHFREIARVAGLIVPGFPSSRAGPRSTARHMQASSELYYDVFKQFDPGNLLLEQARRETLSAQLEFARITDALTRFETQDLRITSPGRLTPMSFPLWADRLRQQLSTEQWTHRVERMLQSLEQQAAGGEAVHEEVDPAVAEALAAQFPGRDGSADGPARRKPLRSRRGRGRL